MQPFPIRTVPRKLTSFSTFLAYEVFLLHGRSLRLPQGNPQLQRGVSARLTMEYMRIT